MFVKALLFLISIPQITIVYCKEDEKTQLRLSGGLIEGRLVKFGDQKALAFMVRLSTISV